MIVFRDILKHNGYDCGIIDTVSYCGYIRLKNIFYNINDLNGMKY